MQSLLSQESIGLLIGAARRRIKQAAWRHLRPHGVTPPQFGILLLLEERKQACLHDLAERLWLDDPTAARIVQKLIERKLVRADEDASDRRRLRLTLTAPGRALVEQIGALAPALQALIERGLSPTERKAIRSGLRRIIANLDHVETPPDLPARRTP